ncbi:ADP-ribosylglycohydrolase family protein [Nocardiopsis valliformis]|uniref:ADP-ribosylglycohydrolase family protein n=1 Tax=Nocardiopsis valliformis TaxID=239974 RepID=UPI00034A8151|nr:ADP-ribosylglycohydrolase family protein [Nocardiopsis valliformis]
MAPSTTDPARSTREDRAAGVLLGSACGDALGVPYEFAARLGPGEIPEMVSDRPHPCGRR